MCNWPWLVPACGGGAAPAGAIRAGKAFGGNGGGQLRGNGLPQRGPPKAPGRRPGGNQNTFNGLGGRGGAGGFNGGSGGNGNRLPGSFISNNPARQPSRTSARPVLNRAPKVGPGSFDIGELLIKKYLKIIRNY